MGFSGPFLTSINEHEITIDEITNVNHDLLVPQLLELRASDLIYNSAPIQRTCC